MNIAAINVWEQVTDMLISLLLNIFIHLSVFNIYWIYISKYRSCMNNLKNQQKINRCSNCFEKQIDRDILACHFLSPFLKMSLPKTRIRKLSWTQFVSPRWVGVLEPSPPSPTWVSNCDKQTFLEIHMVNKLRKKCLALMAIKAIQIKTTEKYYCTLFRIVIIKTPNNDKCWCQCGEKGR